MKYNVIGQGVVTLPGSKSIALRSLIIASFLKNPIVLINFPQCTDALTLLDALHELGFISTWEQDDLILTPPGESNRRPIIKIKDSAAALRFLIVRLAGWPDMEAEISISPQLEKRPIDPLLEIIREMGGEADRQGNLIGIIGNSSLKLSKQARSLLWQHATLSSQFISAVLLSAPIFNEMIVIDPAEQQVSSSYLSLTLDVMQSFGMKIEKEKKRISIPQQEYLNPGIYFIEEDFSSACYFWALGALSKQPIGVKTGVSSSHQADFQFLDILKQMGAIVELRDQSITVRQKDLHGIEVDMNEMPDQVPTMVTLALFADSTTRIKNIHHLRYKESDRIAALIKELTKIGAKIDFVEDVLSIQPLNVNPGQVVLNTYQDHRLVMAFSILTSIFSDLKIDNQDAVQKSFPEFFDKLREIIK